MEMRRQRKRREGSQRRQLEARWLCLEPRPHLAPTQFFIHSHNPHAADLMVMQMYAAGFRVEARPFGENW